MSFITKVLLIFLLSEQYGALSRLATVGKSNFDFFSVEGKSFEIVSLLSGLVA